MEPPTKSKESRLKSKLVASIGKFVISEMFIDYVQRCLPLHRASYHGGPGGHGPSLFAKHKSFCAKSAVLVP